MPSDSPLLAPVQSRRGRRRLVLYIFGSTVLILVLHATFSSSPLIAEGVNPHYDRYTQSVNEWKSKGAAALNGAMDGWRQAGGKTGYEEEAQEFLEVDEGYMENGVRVDYDPLAGLLQEQQQTQGQEQQVGAPEVQEVEGVEAPHAQENNWDWPAAWPIEEHQPEQQETPEQQWQEPSDNQEAAIEEVQVEEAQGAQSEQQSEQEPEEQHQQFEQGQHEQEPPVEQDNQDGQEQNEQHSEGVSWEEIKEESNTQEEQQQDPPFIFEPESQDGDNRQEGQETDHQEWRPEDQQEQQQSEQAAGPQEDQANPSEPPADFHFDQPDGQASSDGESPNEQDFTPPSEPSEAPSTERFEFNMNLPDNLAAHDSFGQPRIVILQHVFPSDTVSRRLFSLSEAAYKSYADYWGYKYVRDDGVYMPNEYEARRKGMNKLYPVLKVMIEELGKEDGAEWMLMTDADTIPINPSVPVHHLIPPSPDVWFLGNEDWNGFNAGNMLLRISRETVAFMSHVIAREVDMSRYENTGKYVSAPPSDQEALCQSFAEDEWKEHFYRVPMKWFNAYSSPYEPTQETGGPVNLPWTDGGEQQEGVWTPQLNFHLVFILKHYRETEDLKGQMERVWRKMADDEGWARDVQAKTQFAAAMWWSQYKDGENWRAGVPPKCMGF